MVIFKTILSGQGNDANVLQLQTLGIMICLYSDDVHTLAGIKDFNSKLLVIDEWFTKIGADAMKGDLRLQELIIPDTVTEIGNTAFCNCKSLKSIRLPRSVIRMGFNVFSSCVSLKSVCFPNGWTSTFDYTFDGCTSLQQVNIPDTMENIGVRTFSSCTSLKHIHIPDNVERICKGAFEGCTSLQSIVLPKQLTKIDDSLFYGCSSLRHVTIPDGVTEICNKAFSGCSSLTEIKFPKELIYIGSEAFSSSGIRHIIIPSTVECIHVGAFWNCHSLKSIEISGDNPSYTVIDGVLYNKLCTKILAYPSAKKGKTFSIPESVTEIGAGAFLNCNLLEDVIVTRNVIEINRWAFAGCKNLRSIVLEGDVEEIEEGTFYGCKSLHNVVLPLTLKHIKSRSFKNCASLEEIIIPPSVIAFGDYAFEGCISLKSIRIPFKRIPTRYDSRGAEKKIDFVRLLSGCYSLQRIDVDENNEFIKSIDGVLYNKTNTELLFYPCGKQDLEYTIPESVKRIGRLGFNNCKYLKRITLPSLIRTCPRFEGCMALECVTITGATEILNDTFKGCLSLKELHIRVDDIYTVKVSEHAFEDVVYHRCKLYVYAEHVPNVKFYPGLGQFKNVKIEAK